MNNITFAVPTRPEEKFLWASLPFKVFCATTTKDYAWFAEIPNHPQKAMTSFITAPKSILQYKRCFLGDYHYQHTYTNTATPINFSDWRSQGSVSKFKPGLALNKGSCRQWTLTIESFCVKGNDCIIATPSSQFDWNGAVCFYVLLSTLMEVKWDDYLVVVHCRTRLSVRLIGFRQRANYDGYRDHVDGQLTNLVVTVREVCK